MSWKPWKRWALSATVAPKPVFAYTQYLSCQNIYDTQKILARSAPNPWMQPIKYLCSNAPKDMTEAISRLERTAVREAEINGEAQAAELKLAATELSAIHSQLTNAELPISGVFVLNPLQKTTMNKAWDCLESFRKRPAGNLQDTIAPFIDDIKSPSEPHWTRQSQA